MNRPPASSILYNQTTSHKGDICALIESKYHSTTRTSSSFSVDANHARTRTHPQHLSMATSTVQPQLQHSQGLLRNPRLLSVPDSPRPHETYREFPSRQHPTVIPRQSLDRNDEHCQTDPLRSPLARPINLRPL